jgi:hypothetical protein
MLRYVHEFLISETCWLCVSTHWQFLPTTHLAPSNPYPYSQNSKNSDNSSSEGESESESDDDSDSSKDKDPAVSREEKKMQ